MDLYIKKNAKTENYENIENSFTAVIDMDSER